MMNNNDVAIVAEILSANISDRMFVGKSQKECQVASLTFANGYIQWTMNGDGGVYSMPHEYVIRNSAEIPCFYPDFFSFVEFVRQVNDVCKSYAVSSVLVRSIKTIAITINTHFDRPSMIDLSNKAFSVKSIDSRIQSYHQARNAKKEHALVKTTTFVSYLRSILPSHDAAVDKIISNVKLFLSTNQLIADTSDTSLLEFDQPALDRKLVWFDSKYNDEWKWTLQQNYNIADLNAFEEYKNGANEFYASIKFGARCSLPYVAAYRFLRRKQLEKDPVYQANAVKQARLEKFAGL